MVTPDQAKIVLETWEQDHQGMLQLIQKMYEDLEKYADQPNASEYAIRKRNEVISQIVDFTNYSAGTILMLKDLVRQIQDELRLYVLIDTAMDKISQRINKFNGTNGSDRKESHTQERQQG